MGEVTKSAELIKRLTTAAIISDVIGIIIWIALSAIAVLFIVQIGKSADCNKHTHWRYCNNCLTGIAIFVLTVAIITIIIGIITIIANTVDIIRWANVPEIQAENVKWNK